MLNVMCPGHQRSKPLNFAPNALTFRHRMQLKHTRRLLLEYLIVKVTEQELKQALSHHFPMGFLTGQKCSILSQKQLLKAQWLVK